MTEVTEYYDRREHNPNEDEISLQDIYFVLVRRKRTVFYMFILVIIISIAYLLLAPKVYQSSVRILPPLKGEIFLTNLDGVKLVISKGNLKEDTQDDILNVLPLNTSKDIFDSLKNELHSNAAWSAFVKKHAEWFSASPGNAGDGENMPDNPLVFTKNKDFAGEHAIIRYDGRGRDRVAVILNRYLLDAGKQYVDMKQQQAIYKVKFYITALKSDINASRVTAKLKLEDNILHLKDSLSIARKLGIVDNQLVTIKNPQTLTVVTSALNTPDYMRGTKVLGAELAQLQKRLSASNDAYILGLREKQSALHRLQAIKYTPETFKPLRVDGQVTTPVKIKPKAKLVLALGMVLGLMLGVFAAFFMEFFQKARSAQR